jgi:hypothetical protein
MKKILTMIALFLCLGVASADTKYLGVPPAPQPGLFGLAITPYTFVTGFSADGQTIEGVCGYYGYYNVHAWFACGWDLTGVPTLGVQLCCNSYGEHAPRAVYGTYANFAGDTAGTKTPSNGGRSWLTTP